MKPKTVYGLWIIRNWGFDYQVVVVDNGSKVPLKLSSNFLRHHPRVELITSAAISVLLAVTIWALSMRLIRMIVIISCCSIVILWQQ